MSENSTGMGMTFVPNRITKNLEHTNIFSPGTHWNASYQRVQNLLQYMTMLIDLHACNLKEKYAFMSDMKLGAKST
jgi:hypothetical protein